MNKGNIQIIILRVGKEYIKAPMELKIYTGKILIGNIKLPVSDKK